MIGRLTGAILSKHPPGLMVEVNGVGYELEAPMSTFMQLPAVGGQAVLFTHLQVREDMQLLYGFASEAERNLFRSLLRVSGVGAKMALAILSGMTAQEFVACVSRGDSAALTRLPGVGKKTAERLLVEMRDRVEGMALPGEGAVEPAAGGAPEAPSHEAVNALVALGYKQAEAERMVRSVARPELDAEALIREALRSTLR